MTTTELDNEWNIPTQKTEATKVKKDFNHNWWIWPTVLILISLDVYLKLGA